MIKAMTSQSLIVSCMLVWLASLGAGAQTHSFSADFVVGHAGSTARGPRGRVYVSGGQVRIEAPGFPDGFFIVDRDRRAAWFVRPGQRLFMDAKRSSPLTRWLVPVDADEPCRQWQTMEQIAGGADGDDEWRCDLVGRDLVDSRETIKYLATSRQSHRSYRWVDLQRDFPVKVAAEDGTTVALENIVDAAQPSSLFAIPPDYRKFDPAQLIELIKRSDVWVEPPQ